MIFGDGNIASFADDDCYSEADYVDAVIAAFVDHPDAGTIEGRILRMASLTTPPHVATEAVQRRERP
jgi:hypothetical protein